jgi:AcrR family transcriptional regulator
LSRRRWPSLHPLDRLAQFGSSTGALKGAGPDPPARTHRAGRSPSKRTIIAKKSTSGPATPPQTPAPAPPRARRPAKALAPEPLFGDDRKGQLLEEAARLFGARGYDKTSMRDIASAFGILPGSLYHHFGSKEELFIAVYAAGVNQFIAAVERAIAPHQDAWLRLEAGCIAHLESLLTKESSAATVLADWSTITHSDELRSALVKERDRYEKVFAALTDAIDMPEGVKRRYFRLGLLGAFNWALTWYQPGRDSPATIARQLLALFRSTHDAA